MSSTFRIARIAGIDIGVNWTWLFIFVLVTWSLAVFVFPNQNPGLATETYWLMAVAASLAFFGSILLHELGHALQAQREDVEIDGITLWLLGGVAKFKDMYRTPGAEFRIAIAGPVVTAAIAAVLLLAAWALALPAAVDGVVFWLAFINIIVLAFNLVPALPLDGGRILHAAIWQARDSLATATRIAGAIGKVFGFALIGVGVFALFAGAGIAAVWFIVLGWFISMAADAETKQMLLREALGDLRVRDLMADELVTVQPDVTVGRFMDDTGRRTRFTTYPVVDNGRTLGLVSFRCVADVPREEWDEARIADCMRPLDEVPVVAPDERAADAMTRVLGGGLNRALVLDHDRLAGIVSVTDLARAAEIGRER